MLRKILLCLTFVSAVSAALAAEVPRHFLLGRTDWTSQTFGEACYSMQTKVSNVPCNPALLSLDQNHVGGFVFVGQNVDSLSDLGKVLTGKADVDTAQRFIKKDRPEEINAEAEINWVRESWSFSFVPFRLNYRSEVRDQALTYVSLYGNVESNVRAQKSFLLSDTLRLGVELQTTYRKFVLTDFFATDILAEGGVDRFLPVHDQTSLGLTPGLSWNLENQFEYHPQVSLTINNVEAVNHQYDGFPSDPEAQLGVSIRPPGYDENLELSAHIRIPGKDQETNQLFILAGAYTQEQNTWGTSLNLHQFDFGYHHKFKDIEAGAVLDYQIIEDNRGEEEPLTTLYFQIGAEI
ncbi:MAG: hypothetical protein ACXVAX_05845 [Pseudobdellovibrio sp.]